MRTPDLEHDHSRALKILSYSRFPEALRQSSARLIALHDEAPRIVRYVANIQRWMLTQGLVLLHFERILDPQAPNLTAANLLRLLGHNPVVSKNTAVSQVTEMRTYGLLVDEPMPRDKRARPLAVSDRGIDLIRNWFNGHLESLDLLDGGRRVERAIARPDILYRAHPRAVRMLIADPAWSDPAESLAVFVWTESGSNVLHDLLLRVPADTDLSEKVWAGSLRLSDISNRYLISRSHSQRLFARARELDLIGWEKPGNDGRMWLSRKLIEEYRYWQAVKFAAIDLAWEQTVDE